MGPRLEKHPTSGSSSLIDHVCGKQRLEAIKQLYLSALHFYFYHRPSTLSCTAKQEIRRTASSACSPQSSSPPPTQNPAGTPPSHFLQPLAAVSVKVATTDLSLHPLATQVFTPLVNSSFLQRQTRTGFCLSARYRMGANSVMALPAIVQCSCSLLRRE